MKTASFQSIGTKKPMKSYTQNLYFGTLWSRIFSRERELSFQRLRWLTADSETGGTDKRASSFPPSCTDWKWTGRSLNSASSCTSFLSFWRWWDSVLPRGSAANSPPSIPKDTASAHWHVWQWQWQWQWKRHAYRAKQKTILKNNVWIINIIFIMTIKIQQSEFIGNFTSTWLTEIDG